MKYIPLANSVYIKNREKLNRLLPPNSLAVFHSNDIFPTNADGTLKFRQNNDLFYLTGIDQEETILILCPDIPKEEMRQILFNRKTNEDIARWEGKKYTEEQAFETSGIENIQWTENFDGIFNSMMLLCEHVFLNS